MTARRLQHVSAMSVARRYVMSASRARSAGRCWPAVTEEEALRFLIDLQVISDKHGIIVAACGCCDSPWIKRQTGGVYNLSAEFPPTTFITVEDPEPRVKLASFRYD